MHFMNLRVIEYVYLASVSKIICTKIFHITVYFYKDFINSSFFKLSEKKTSHFLGFQLMIPLYKNAWMFKKEVYGQMHTKLLPFLK